MKHWYLMYLHGVWPLHWWNSAIMKTRSDRVLLVCAPSSNETILRKVKFVHGKNFGAAPQRFGRQESSSVCRPMYSRRPFIEHAVMCLDFQQTVAKLYSITRKVQQKIKSCVRMFVFKDFYWYETFQSHIVTYKWRERFFEFMYK
jgi:hypothetical protein